jgi:hypothetical protein
MVTSFASRYMHPECFLIRLTSSSICGEREGEEEEREEEREGEGCGGMVREGGNWMEGRERETGKGGGGEGGSKIRSEGEKERERGNMEWSHQESIDNITIHTAD